MSSSRSDRTKDEINRDLIRILRKQGILTGSRAFGVSKETSDYDYILSRDIFKKEFEFYIAMGLLSYDSKTYNNDDPDSEGFGLFQSFKMGSNTGTNTRIYNLIIPWNSNGYYAWTHSTEVIQQLPVEVLEDKKNRVYIFEKLKDIYRGSANGKTK